VDRARVAEICRSVAGRAAEVEPLAVTCASPVVHRVAEAVLSPPLL